MRPLIVFSDVTIDGFMAGPHNDLHFMINNSELKAEMTSMLMAVADTIVVGRKTFLDMAAYWSKAAGELPAWMNRTPKVVLTSDEKFDVGVWENASLAAGDGVEQVRRLKALAGGSLVVFGGVKTVQSLVSADLVDEYWLTVNPVVAGRGGSMFSTLAKARALKLRSAKSFASGGVALIYSA